MSRKILFAGFVILILFMVNGCTPDLGNLQFFNFFGGGKKAAVTGLIGGKGVVVEFLPSKPRMDEISGDFSIGLRFLNYNKNQVNIDSVTVGSTAGYKGWENIVGESLSIEGAIVEQRNGRDVLIKPGSEVFYGGRGSKFRDNTIHYGPFRFENVYAGAGTQFFVEMEIGDYNAESVFQFCVGDITGGKSYCDPVERISSSRLGIGQSYDPVSVVEINKLVTSDVEGRARVTLEVKIKDSGKKKGEEISRINAKLGGEEKVTFEIGSSGGGDLGFSCRSRQQVLSGKERLDVVLDVDEGEAVVECAGFTSLGEDEVRDYQYKINLRYPYYQRISTPFVKISEDIGEES